MKVLTKVLAVLAAAGLGYDAYVHLHLAKNYDAIGSTITQGDLFRVEAVVAIAVAVVVLVWENRWVWVAVGLTGLSAVGVVLLYRYVNVGSVGPIPNMYEPTWYGDKTRSAFAEGGVVLVFLVREALRVLSAGSAAGSAVRHAHLAHRS